MDRRGFLGIVAAAAWHRAGRRRASRAARTLRVLHSPSDPPGYSLGARLAADELLRSAVLLGADVDVIATDAVNAGATDAGTGAADAAAFVASGTTAEVARAARRIATRAAAPLLFTAADLSAAGPCSGRVFHTGVPAAEAARVLAAWRATQAAKESGGPATARSESVARVVAWHDALFKYGAEQLNERYRRAFGSGMTGDAWSAWIAVKILGEIALRKHAQPELDFAAALADPRARFDGHKGIALAFRPADGWLRQPLYVLVPGGRESNGPAGKSGAGGAIVAEIAPDPSTAAECRT